MLLVYINRSIRTFILIASTILATTIGSIATGSPLSAEKPCSRYPAALQILGSGGPELSNRASASYLLWIDGHAKLLIDAGPGARLRMAESGGKFEDLDAILLTHLHVDHSADLPAFVKAGYFTERNRPLDVLGPTGNHEMPDTKQWLNSLFGQSGYRYLADYLNEKVDPGSTQHFYLRSTNVDATNPVVREVWRHDMLIVKAAAVAHGSIPALAYRIEGKKFSVAISGDTNGNGGSQTALQALASNASLFVAHHAIPEQTAGVARRLHMPPSRIASIAATALPDQLVLSHRMLRTIGKENETASIIRAQYAGPISFANDLDCFPLQQ